MDELSEAELRYYNDLFKICSETEGVGGKIPALKATSLFRSANLSNEIINKITALAGVPSTALHLSRQQFYGCLKLIAAFQASVPLREEILTTSINLPLPQFSWIDPVASSGPPGSDAVPGGTSTTDAANSGGSSSTGGGTGGTLERNNGYVDVPRRVDVAGGGGGGGGSGKAGGGSTTQDSSASTCGEMTNSDQPSTDSEVEHNDDPVSMIRGERERHTVGMLKGGAVVMLGSTHPPGGSPEAWSTASDSPTPTNSVAERPWANQTLWQGLVCEEQRQLLGTEEESSDRHSSDEDEQEIDLEYFYQISQTQKEYYLKQFRTIQPDVHGLVSGPVARVFFEKSRIPIDELRHIWQMCDVTRDGALNLAEFTAAMHLVVLRRNNIPVPATLPPCLLPTLLQHSLLQPGSTGGTSGGAVPPGSGTMAANISGSVADGGPGATGTQQLTNNNGTVPERTEPAEADLLHLESDDNVPSGTNPTRKRFDATKDYQRMVPVPDSLAFGKVGANAAGSGQVPGPMAAHDSPPSVSSASGTGGSGSIANATKGSSSGSCSSVGPSGTVSSTTTTAVTHVHKTPPNISPPVLTQQQSQSKAKQSSDPATPPNTKNNKEWNSTTKEWTKFMESPTSNVSSPGPKPVNFDLQRTTLAIVSDPQILYPVPIRVTPVGAEAVDNSNGSLVYGADGPAASGGGGGLLRDDSSPKQQQQASQQQQLHHHSTPHQQQQRDSLTNSGDLRAIQRPQPKKPPSKGVGAIPPPPQRDSGGTGHAPSTNATGNDSTMTISLDAAGFAASSTGHPLTKKQSVDQQQQQQQQQAAPPPPLPPPRPSAHRHTRSSSLDLNKLKLTNSGVTGHGMGIGDPRKMPPPPEVPPRVTPTGEQHSAGASEASGGQHHGFADFTHFPSGGATGHRIAPPTEPNNITTIHLDAAGNMTHHSTPRSSGTLPKSLVMHQPRNSAFEVYRKPQSNARGSQSPLHAPAQPPLLTSRSVEVSSSAVSATVAAASAAAATAAAALEHDKSVWALSDSLRQVRFKSNDPPPVMRDALKQLKEQNLLLLRICSDLSDELLHIQQKREDILMKIELQEQILGNGSGSMIATGPSSLPAPSSSSSSSSTTVSTVLSGTHHHHAHHHVGGTSHVAQPANHHPHQHHHQQHQHQHANL